MNAFITALNDLFSTDIAVDDNNQTSVLFNEFLFKMKKEAEEYDSETVLFIKKKNNIDVYFAYNNEIVCETIDIYDKRKFREKLVQYNTIISNFAICTEIRKSCYRVEIIKNYFSGYDCHYFDKELYYPNDDFSVYFIKSFQAKFKSHKLVNFASFLLSYFENGHYFGDIYLHPSISVSQYGRWYLNNAFKIQNSKECREQFINNMIEQGYPIMSIDLKSAEGNEFYALYPSENVAQLLSNRKFDGDISSISKLILNIFIHSKADIDILKYVIEKKIGNVDKYFDGSLNNFLLKLLSDTSVYDKQICQEYRKKKLKYRENARYITNPMMVYMNNDIENIVEHKKYLQGHVHDKIIMLSQYLYQTKDILPIYFIHDEVAFIYDKAKKEEIEKILSKFKIPAKLNVYDR